LNRNRLSETPKFAIYVRSEKAGRRVMTSLTRFIEGRLKLQINAEKSAVARPWHRSFLGFTVKDDPAFRRCIADRAVTRFKDRVRELTRRHRGVSLEKMIADLNPFVRGWVGYFGFSQWHELPSLGWGARGTESLEGRVRSELVSGNPDL
jgi:RNA-directed DNA polymerase